MSHLAATLVPRRLVRRHASSGSTTRREVLAFVACAALVVTVLVPLATSPARAAGSGQWYAVDTHAHSVFSGDARSDLGVLAQTAKAAGYNALMVTDHALGSSFPISGQTANKFVMDDALTEWTAKTLGTVSAPANALVASPVHTGSKSLHLAATAASGQTGEVMEWGKRGPNLRSGDITLTFSVYPTRIDPGSGVYVSLAIGGDPTVSAVSGYTTASGAVSQGKYAREVWQLGNPVAASSTPGALVITHQLSYTLNQWNTYTIDVSKALATDLPAAAQPISYDPVEYPKLAVAAAGGSVDAYLDSYALTAAAPVDPATEFAYRNSLLPGYTVPGSFEMFGSVEIGVQQHANRFNFDPPVPSQQQLQLGIDSIPVTQASGYPAQLNHPGVAGGVTDAQAISTGGEHADLMEVRELNMIADWDAILSQGVVLPGTWSTDEHDAYLGSSFPATYVNAPALTFNDLTQNMFEGRMYLAKTNFGGRLTFAPAGTSTVYPSRYPIYVSPVTGTTAVHLNISGGLTTGDQVRWLVGNGSSTTPTVLANEATSGSTYDATKQVPTAGAASYVRAEVTDSTGVTIKAMTEPIMFAPTTALPVGMSYHLQGVSTTDGTGYTITMTKGITASSWNSSTRTLAATLTDRPGSLAELDATTGALAPTSVTVDGAAVPAATSQAAFTAATGSTWYYDSTAGQLYVKALQGSGASSAVAVAFSSTDTTAPTTPAGLSATAAGATAINLSWSPSTDNTAVAGYGIYRDGSANPIASVTSGTTFADTGLAPSSSHTYTVDAYDAAGNHSAKSAPATARTSADATPPTMPANLTARAASGTAIALSWTPSTDNVGVTGYGIYRDGSATALANVTTGTTYTDATVAPGSTHSYAVDAVDAAGNRSAKSATASATTPTTGGTVVTINPDADSYVDASNPTKNFGTSTAIKVDGSPPVTSYLHFTVTGLTGPVTSATLRMFPSTNQKTGFDAHAVTGAWTETGITAANAPAYSSAVLGSSGRVTASVWAAADVTPLITGNGTYSIALTTSDPQALSMSSREGANPPQLVITTNAGGGGGTDTTPPTTPTGLTATANGPTEIDLSWTASTDNVGVTGYHVYRDGSTTALTTVAGPAYHDTVAAGSTHTYTVDAYDAAGNTSGKATAASATTPTSGGSGGTVTVLPTADAYVDPTNPTKNYGTTTTMRVDGSPVVVSYLRFTVAGLTGAPTKAMLRIYANSAQATGYDVHSVADSTWAESAITAANAPTYASAIAGSSGKVTAGTWTSVDISALITGNGTYSIALVTTSSVALSMSSREGANPPQLLITP